MKRSKFRAVASATAVVLTLGVVSGPVMAAEDNSAALAVAATSDHPLAEPEPEAIPAAVVAAARGFAFAYRVTPAFRQGVNSSASQALRAAGGIGQFFGFATRPAAEIAAEEALLDR